MTVLEGVVREPLYRSVPDCRQSFGDLAARVGVDLGLPPDDEQRVVLDAIYAEREPGVPAARHVAIIGPRQTVGKTATLEVAAATDMFVLGVRDAVWTAHQSKTSTKTFEDLQRRILANPDYADLTRGAEGFHRGRGEEKIFLPGDEQVCLQFAARSGGSGRGFTTDRLTLDEALFLRAGDVGALLPTMVTRLAAQVRYGSSAGLSFSETLRDIRDRGRAGIDSRLFYVEFGAERRACEQGQRCGHRYGIAVGCALDDRELWWQANSGLWFGRVAEEDIEDLRRSMPWEEFCREMLSWWEDPLGAGQVISAEAWARLADPDSEVLDPVTLGVEIAHDLASASIGLAGSRADGKWHVECPKNLPGMSWLPDSVARAMQVQAVAQVVVDERSPGAGPLIEALQNLGIEPVIPGPRDLCAGFSQWVNACKPDQDQLRHRNQPEMNLAIEVIRTRALGDQVTWERKGAPADVSPVTAASLALWGHVRAASEPTPMVLWR